MHSRWPVMLCKQSFRIAVLTVDLFLVSRIFSLCNRINIPYHHSEASQLELPP
jgi:hypothetical protein